MSEDERFECGPATIEEARGLVAASAALHEHARQLTEAARRLCVDNAELRARRVALAASTSGPVAG
jgi:hypothetical protein